MTAGKKKLLIFAALLGLIALGYRYGGEYATLDFVKGRQADFAAYYEANPASALVVFFLLYVGVAALSLPGALLVTLLAGALFGLVAGVVVVSFASSIGATLAFLVSRFLLGQSLQEKYGDKLQKINEGVSREGAFYLFTMRLIPVFPFFLINILMGLTPIRAVTFYWVSQVGMLAGTVVYVNAGKELGKLDSAADILSPGLFASFVILAVFPLAVKKIIGLVKKKRAGGDNGNASKPED